MNKMNSLSDTKQAKRRILDDRQSAHAGHRIVNRAPDMAGRPVIICITCNVRLKEEL